jgi:hypothetical protein
LLVNLQPLGESMDLEVRLGAERPGTGRVFDDEEAQEDMKSAHRTLAALADEGLFTLHDTTTFRLEFHFHTAEDWREFLARPKAGSVEADPQLLAAALAHPQGSIVTTEQTSATTYDRAMR